MRLAGNSIVDEGNRVLEVPAWKNCLLADAEPGNSMWLDHTPPALSQQRDGWCRRAHNQLYSPFVIVCPISHGLDSADHTVTFPGGRGRLKISWVCSAGCCRFLDTYGRECCKLILPRSIADKATIWELAGLSWVMPWESLKRYSLLKLSTVQK
jgi:hypothetical protein